MNYKEITVANVNDMVDGEMKKITVEENVDILLIRTNGTYNALGAYCSHYGASLDEGLICGDHVCCPWHHACFNIESGTCTEPPALNDLPRYEVKVKDNDVILYLPEKPSQSLEPSMVTQDLGRDKRMFVIVGGGAAGDSAAQSLRQVGYSGRIIMITREKWAPYDRTNLSKSYLQGTGKKEWLPLHSKNFYRENNIELMFSSEVTDIDSKNQEITIADGKCVKYDRILVATGGKPRQLNISGSGTDKVFTLRSFDDAELIIKAADQVSNIIVIGASFIGLETAFSFTKRDKKVTVVGLENVPFEYVLGKEIGNMIKAVHEQKGVQFKL
ncbi:MAG: FAD-dependent oxidoreductase, partial [Candidatus Latescibacteria bacterium]|nr:FAD-dependent oxidoreductase [Candidatus Latescibacterota bacterium]